MGSKDGLDPSSAMGARTATNAQPVNDATSGSEARSTEDTPTVIMKEAPANSKDGRRRSARQGELDFPGPNEQS